MAHNEIDIAFIQDIIVLSIEVLEKIKLQLTSPLDNTKIANL